MAGGSSPRTGRQNSRHYVTWFKIDDAWWRGKKMRRLSRRRKVRVSEQVGAAGVWALCGDWSADQLTDGFVPWEVVEDWDPARELAEVLIRTGWWYPDASDGEEGVRFHDWSDWNPVRSDVEKKREQSRERVRRWRERHHGSDAVTSEDTDRAAVTNVSDHHVSNGVGNALHNGLETPPPTRPDPKRRRTPPTPPLEDDFLITADAAIGGIESDFETWWAQWPRKIAKPKALESYRKARKKKIPAELLLTTAAQQLAAWRAAGRAADKIPHATTWLNQERWNDEVERPTFTVITNPDSPWQGMRIDASDSPWAADMGWPS